jgi:hypothetical protein
MVVSQQFVLSNTTPTKIVAGSTSQQEVHLHNMTKSSNEFIHVGPSNVTTTNSIHIDPAQSMSIVLAPGDDLWAVSNPNGLTVGVLAIKR